MAIYAKGFRMSFSIYLKCADYSVNTPHNIVILKKIIKKLAVLRGFLHRWVDFLSYICYN